MIPSRAPWPYWALFALWAGRTHRPRWCHKAAKVFFKSCQSCSLSLELRFEFEKCLSQRLNAVVAMWLVLVIFEGMGVLNVRVLVAHDDLVLVAFKGKVRPRMLVLRQFVFVF